MQFTDELDPAAILAAVGSVVHQRRSLDIEEFLLALRWADLHGDDPQRIPGAVPARYGGDRLVQLGGDGTPMVQDLCIHELAIARQVHPITARILLADVLDLRHRLPLTWAKFLEHGCEGWLVRKVAALSRNLDRHAVAIVDAAVADALTTESAGRVLRITEAKVIEADLAAHTAALDAKRRAKHVTFTQSDEHGLRYLIARIEAGDAVWLDATIDRLADLLNQRRDLVPDLPPDCSKDELRSVALGWLARPEDAHALLTGTYSTPHTLDPEDTETGDTETGDTETGDTETGDTETGDTETGDTETGDTETGDTASTTGRSGRPGGPGRSSGTGQHGVVYVHLHQAALQGIAAGVARVEDLGPMLLTQLRELLGHTNVTLTPVIDLNTSVSVNAYEHPEAVKERTHLRTCGEVFPHAVSQTRRTDTDHPVPYEPNGPPGQTGDHNAARLRRSNHRAKTHKGYRVKQLGPGEYLWTTPNGLRRLVNAYGTHDLDENQAWHLEHPDAMNAAIDRLIAKLDNGALTPPG